MPIKDYKNYDDIKETPGKAIGSYIDGKTAALIEVGVEFPYNTFGGSDDKIEFHAYSIEDNPLGSKFEGVQYQLAPKSGSDGASILQLNPDKELNELGFSLGKYKYTYNVYQQLTHNNCYIHTISPSRTEALIFPVKTRNFYNDFKTNLEFTHFANKVNIGASVGFEMFDINQDGNVSILDILEGRNVGFNSTETGSDGQPIKEFITPAETMIMVDYILGYNAGQGSPGNYIGGEFVNNTNKLETKLSVEKLKESGFPLDKLQSLNTQGGTNEEAWLKLAQRVLRNYQQFDTLDPETLDIYANFGDNQFSLITNWVKDDITYPEAPHGIVVKFLEPLPEEITERTQLSLTKFYSPPVIDKINLVGVPQNQRQLNILAPHNKEIDVNFKPKQMEQFETWEDILGANPTTQQNLVDFYLSGSYLEQNLNIDFTDYRNFVKFSSATERLANFKYKLGLIESYDSKSDAYTLVSGSTGTVNHYKELKRELISGLDSYEKFLYYESGSYISESGLGATGTVDFQDATAPKQNSSKPYRLFSVTSSEFTTWYANQSSNALNHDNFNDDSLQNNTPIHIKQDSDSNAEYLLFLNMMGQHFDTVWTYSRHMTDISQRDHNINSQYNYSPDVPGTQNFEGLHKDLTYFIAQAHGLKLNNGNDLVKLWKYALGENQYNDGTITVSESKITIQDGAFSNDLEDGTLFIPSTENPSGSTFEATVTSVYHNSASISPAYSGEFSSSNYTITYDIPDSQDSKLSANDYTKEIWRRLLNNLPYLLKTKGTARSVKALVTCYGIPQTILQIQEYGGPTAVGKQIYTKQSFAHALHFTGSNQYVDLNWKATSTTSRRPDSLQFRFAFDEDLNTAFTPSALRIGTVNDGNSGSVRLATLGGGTTASVNWDIRANTLSGSVYHDIGQGASTTVVPSFPSGIPGKGQYNTVSSSMTDWGYLSFNISGSEGYKTMFSEVLPIFNKKFWQVTLQRTSASDASDIDQTYELYVKQAVGDRVSFSSHTSMSFSASQASYKSSFTSSDNLYIGDSGSDMPHFFSGSISEVRLWNKPLLEKTINIHTKAPYSFAGGTTSSFYDNLEVRFPFNSQYEFETPGVSTPNVLSSSNIANIQTYQETASLINFGTTNKSLKGFDIENNFEIPNIGANRLTSNKIRIENATLDGNLNTKIRAEKRANDYSPVDSPKLDIYFSPVKPINDDIIADFSGLELDDLLGDPADIYKDRYTELEKLRKLYFNRYDNINNFFDYIRLIQMYDSTLFDQIKNLLPYRAHESVGLLIEPHLLERSKFSGWKKPVKEETHFRNQKGKDIPGENIAIDYYDRGLHATHSLEGTFRYNSGSVDLNTDSIAGEADLYNIVGGQVFNDTVTLGNKLEVNLASTSSLTAPTVDDLNIVVTSDIVETSASKETELNVELLYNLTSSGNVEDGLQNGISTTYLADIKKFHGSHESSSYIVGFGGAGYVSNPELWHGNPEKEAYHPFIHKQVLNYKYLVHSASQYECVLTDGQVVAKNQVPYGYWDNDRSITGSIDSSMASLGFLPSEAVPPNNYAYKSQKYNGTKNKLTTTYDGKEPVESHETSPTVLVVSDTSPNTLQVQ